MTPDERAVMHELANAAGDVIGAHVATDSDVRKGARRRAIVRLAAAQSVALRVLNANVVAQITGVSLSFREPKAAEPIDRGGC